MIKRTVLFIVLCAVIWVGNTYYNSVAQPEISTQLSIATVNGDAQDAANMRAAQQIHGQVPLIAFGLTLGAGLLCYGAYVKRGIEKLKENF